MIMKVAIDFKKGNGLVPVIVQDSSSREVYLLGFMNNEALTKTITTGIVHFWSRSRKKLWMKGEESGNTLQVEEIYKDCDNDTLLVSVKLLGNAVCHTGNKSCFYTKVEVKR